MAIADESFVLLTTFKRDGTGVGTPVWIAPLPGGRAGFTTATTTWKVKRLRRDPRVTVQACDRRGRVKEGAPVLEGTGEVLTAGPELVRVREAIRRKYGWQVPVLHFIQDTIKRLRRRPVGANDAVVVMTLES